MSCADTGVAGFPLSLGTYKDIYKLRDAPIRVELPTQLIYVDFAITESCRRILRRRRVASACNNSPKVRASPKGCKTQLWGTGAWTRHRRWCACWGPNDMLTRVMGGQRAAPAAFISFLCANQAERHNQTSPTHDLDTPLRRSSLMGRYGMRRRPHRARLLATWQNTVARIHRHQECQLFTKRSQDAAPRAT